MTVETWQRCPVCEGKGTTPQIGTTQINTAEPTCTVCLGRKIISALTGNPPNYNILSNEQKIPTLSEKLNL